MNKTLYCHSFKPGSFKPGLTLLLALCLCAISSAQMVPGARMAGQGVRRGNPDLSDVPAVAVSPGNWSQLGKLVQFEHDSFCCSRFGTSVGISGDTVVVGDPDTWAGGTGAYLFLKPESG